jgi:hypothetical protein
VVPAVGLRVDRILRIEIELPVLRVGRRLLRGRGPRHAVAGEHRGPHLEKDALTDMLRRLVDRCLLRRVPLEVDDAAEDLHLGIAQELELRSRAGRNRDPELLPVGLVRRRAAGQSLHMTLHMTIAVALLEAEDLAGRRGRADGGHSLRGAGRSHRLSRE